ncbi:GGDEF/EAL domain-containing response regulator [Kamptonema formosum]|uniref:GGDEF/EAL domain-containing response regulator n=1 Tax=Kamptonema formosum TaxID=331992 RepID=UPI00034BE8D0|nr:EAL domain-containing protein [Oscillatoria sp. PCC 10802]
MSAERIDPSQKNILIVDDNPNNLRYLAPLLMEEGYKVRKALTGQMAIKACQSLLPDLILLDIMMPDLDGYEVCHRLKAADKTSKIPVIFLSALDDVFDKVRAFKVGGADYISKPFQVEEILVRIQNQLALKEAEIKISRLNAELEQRVQERTRQLEIANQDLLQEIVERKQLQNQLLHLALHDSLTGTPNRALFTERLERAIERAKEQPDCQFAVLFLDCDRFKVVNDSLGHLVGDELLIAIARRLEASLREADTLARLGGDEFAILLENIPDISTATQVAEGILEKLSSPFMLSRHEVFINASIGITPSHICGDKPEYLLRDADTAMYRAKALGKGRYHVFDPAMHQEALQTLQLENDLRRAVGSSEFLVYYQPIVALNTGRIAGFEALVRWRHPERGLVSPAEFIPVAEETGLIASIDTWVLRESCKQLSIWQEKKLADASITVSVNVSARHFLQPNLIEEIDRSLQETQLNPQNLKLEITESAIMEDGGSARGILQQLRERQIGVSLDDFGTGYSSLSYLHCFPVSGLKIDQSFVKRMDGSPENSGLVPAIVGIARTMRMSAVAEGVETPAQLAQLRSLGCDFGQGYLFSKPLESQLAATLLAAAPQW